DVLGVNPAAVFVKRRERQRGSAQYERRSSESVIATVAENGLLFEVNLSDYLDTGIFLDHRDTRQWLREQANGARFLNLFAYTGTATAYAAAGGARATTTVDLSSTYLDWARRNLERNGLARGDHEFVRADVIAWLVDAEKRGERYDLVFCDPPTFSNSKRMDATWDVQRDHVALVIAAARLLADGGTLVFSCNRRKFALDVAALAEAGLEARDITKRTIPKDFESTPWVHTCWTIRRAGERS
ncbi:MAG: methyltransferase, partial [Actinobacteria bacterium]